MMLIVRRPCTVDSSIVVRMRVSKRADSTTTINSHPTNDVTVLRAIRFFSSYFFPPIHLYRINTSLMSLRLYFRTEIEIDFFFENIIITIIIREMFLSKTLLENSWNRHRGFTTNKDINFSDLNRDLEARKVEQREE